MNGNYYDVVVLGTQLGPLLAGTLLAKRGFRVLVLGQEDLPPTYDAGEGLTLPRAPFSFTAAGSPVARRIFAELALNQLFRRRALAMDPVFQVALPRHRLDLPESDAELEREIEREFPEVRRPVEDFHRGTKRANAELDRLLERDLVWPPETFFERREFARASAQLSFDKSGGGRDPFAELREEHPFRLVVQAPARFLDGMDPDYPTQLRLSRLYGSALRGSTVLEGGEAGLRQMLVEKLRTHSGELRERDRADAVLLRRGVAVGVRLANSGEEIGASFVAYGGDVSGLLRLLPDRRPFEELFERLGEPQARWFRYTLNLVLAGDGVPVGMARDVYFIRDARRPLSAENLLHIEAHPPDASGRRLLCVETLLPRRGIEDVPGYIDGVRERVFASLGDLVPFLGRTVQLIDSPHDGRPVLDVRTGRSRPAPEPWTRGPQTMRTVYGYPVTGTLGLSALPVRTPVRRLLLCSGQTTPGLGMEGHLLAAWSAARIVTRADRRKAWMRGRLWTKVEI